MLLYAFFAIFELVTFDVIYLKSVRVKHIDCLSLVVPLFVNYRDLGVDFLKLAQLLIDDYVESNPGPTKSDCKSLCERPKKIKVFKETPKKFDFSENSMLMWLVIQIYKMSFLIQYSLS